MIKLDYNEINNQQLIDSRSQHNYQTGHIRGSLNFNPKNFKKYAEKFIAFNQPIIFIVENENKEDLEELYTIAEQEGYNDIKGHILIDDISNENLQNTDTITASNFLNEREDYILLDVRNRDEITRPAPEKNMVNIPLENLANDYQSLDKSKKIYTLCGSGNRGTSAASYLSSKGFNTTVIEGGMKGIQELK